MRLTIYRLLCYALRGHGMTVASDLAHYTIATFAEDLSSLLDALGIHSLIICGLSLGEVIAQTLAVHNLGRLRALGLAGTAVSVRLTLCEKLLRYVLLPRRAGLLTIRVVGVKHFTRFSLRLARVKWSKQWLGRGEDTRKYVEQCMLKIDGGESCNVSRESRSI